MRVTQHCIVSIDRIRSSLLGGRMTSEPGTRLAGSWPHLALRQTQERTSQWRWNDADGAIAISIQGRR